MTDNKLPIRYFIVSSGRAGSTLLSSIIAQAGADFGCGDSAQWDRRAGAFELKIGSHAAEHHNRAIALKDNSHISRWQMLRRKYHRSMAKKNTRKLMQQAQWIKLSSSGVIRMARAVDYQPRVILLYRPFANYAYSSFLRSGRHVPQMIEHYYNTYADGLLALNIYGGCVVEYSEIIDRNNDAWLERVAALSNLESANLITARDAIVDQQRSEDTGMAFEDYRLADIDKLIGQHRGRLIEPHRLAGRRV